MLFYKKNIYCYYCDVFIEKYTKFNRNWYCVSELHGHIYVPIVMYGLRLFIAVLQELHCLSNCLHVYMIRVRGCYHFTKFCGAGRKRGGYAINDQTCVHDFCP